MPAARPWVGHRTTTWGGTSRHPRGPGTVPGHTDVDGHDAAIDLADAAEVLSLHARRPVAPLAATRLVDHSDRPQRIVREIHDGRLEVLLERVAGRGMFPRRRGEELLEGPHGRSGGQGNGFNTLAW